MKNLKRYLLYLCFAVLPQLVLAQNKPTSAQLNGFKALLSDINGTFALPEGFKEVMPPSNNKLPFQFGLKMLDADFEIWFEVNSVKADWQRYETNKQTTNPDSLYRKIAAEQATIMSGSPDYITRELPPSMLERYNADEGRSYFFALTDLPATNHYQYALIIVLQKNHYGNILAVCFGNERGPSFYKNATKLKGCFRFIN